MPLYAIGDVQGCFEELETLLGQIRFDPGRDCLWFAGDLVNRGSRSLDCLRFVRSLGSAAVTVLGNHDLHLLALALTRSSKSRPKDTLDEVLKAPDRDDLIDWLRHQPLMHFDASLHFALIHAGLPPQWDADLAQACAQEVAVALANEQTAIELLTNMYGDEPAEWSDELEGIARLRFIVNCFTRLRFCDAKGKLALKHKGSAERAPPGLYPWFKVPGRRTRNLRIVCGHWSALGYYEGDGVVAVDTGCVWGGSLCAVRLDAPAPPMLVPCSSSGLKPGED